MSNQKLFLKGDVASIFEDRLSDGSTGYNVRIYDSRENFDVEKYFEFPANDDKHAHEIFEALNRLS